MGINKSTTKKLEYHKVFWPGNIKSTGTVIRQFRVTQISVRCLYFWDSLNLFTSIDLQVVVLEEEEEEALAEGEEEGEEEETEESSAAAPAE